MKNYLLLICAAFFAVLSCSKSKPTPDPRPDPVPVINVETEIIAGYEAAVHKFGYSISNPVDNAEVNVLTDTPWIENIVVGEAEVSFSLDVNEGDSERFGTISLSYPGADDVTVNIIQEAPPVRNLSADGTANCYIVSNSGTYFFRPVKGNSDMSVGDIAYVSVLWESFGTSVTPSVGDLISEVSFDDDNIVFSTSEVFKEGNAVIAAWDAGDNILWSWHIWMTDRPDDQIYNNNAGTMMDRNIGAVTATSGEAGALGLMYQWGRKDPFPASSLTDKNRSAKATIPEPDCVIASGETATIEYTVAHPTTILIPVSSGDWLDCYDLYPDNSDILRWKSDKTVYDPCPPGYRVPDGGENGIWAKAFGCSEMFEAIPYRGGRGYNFGSFGWGDILLCNLSDVCWYPFSGLRDSFPPRLTETGIYGYVWSCTLERLYSPYAYAFEYQYTSSVMPSSEVTRASSLPVRCMKESR